MIKKLFEAVSQFGSFWQVFVKPYLYFNCCNWMYHFNQSFWCYFISNLTYISVWLVFSFDQSFHVCLFDLRYTHSLHQQLIFLDYFVKKLLFSFYVYLYFFYQPVKICSKVYSLYQSNLWQLNKYLMDVAQVYCKF